MKVLEVSNNSLSIMRSCGMKFKWHYIDGLRPIKKSSALALGSVLHSAFEMHYNKFSTVDVLQYISDTMDEQIKNAAPEEQEDIQLTKYTLTGMWVYYPMDLTEFTDIKPEIEFRVKVPKMRGVYYVGKIDGLVTDVNGKMWVRELKTTSMSFGQFEVRARQSPQGTGYIWAMRQLGYPVQGMIYDYVKKPLLRKGMSENINQFGDRIVKDYQTRPDIYYKRLHSYRHNEELDLFEEDLRNGARDVRMRKKDNQWHRNQESCWDWNSECPYLKICFRKVPDPLTVQLFYEKKP